MLSIQVMKRMIKSIPLPLDGKTIYVTEFAKRGLIHASDFPTLTKRNFICKQVIRLKFSILLVQ